MLYGRADEESVSPYQPFVEALRHYAAHRPGLTDETPLPAARGRRSWRALVPELGPCRCSGRGSRSRRRASARGIELFDARRAAAAARRRPAAAAARPGGPALGRCPDAAAAPARCFAAAPDRVCSSSRPTATWTRTPAARWVTCSPTSGGTPAGDDPPRGAWLPRRRPRSWPPTSGGGPADERSGAAAVRPDRRQPVLHRGAAAHPARSAGSTRRRAGRASRT